MAHELDMSNNRANMAYVGEVPWHGLGQELPTGADLETWRIAAGMDWALESNPLMFMSPEEGGILRPVPDRVALTRSDTQAHLSIVSTGYKVVQPAAVLEFYRDLVGAAGFSLETAGVLFGGRKFWALAKINESARIMGQDEINGYLLLATSCDGSLATTAQFTSIRVVCNNTLSYSINAGEAGRSRKYLKIPHNREFDAEQVKAELGIASESWEQFITRANALANKKLERAQAIQIMADALKVEMVDEETGDPIDVEDANRTLRDIMKLYDGAALGSSFRSADGTAWGLMNAVTEFADHRRNTKTTDNRLNSAWFGEGAALKDRVFDLLMAA